MALLIKNANILTMDAACPRANAAAVIGEYFAYVGDETSARGVLSGAGFGEYEELNCEGRFVMPGFNDSHMHFISGYVGRKRSVDLSGCMSIEEVIACLKAGIARLNVQAGQWVVGEGWNQDCFEGERRFPTHLDLDMASTDVAIVAYRVCSHVAVINSKGMALSGIDGESVKQYDDYAARWPDGSPNGVFKETAMEAIRVSLPEFTAEEQLDAVLGSQTDLFRAGITSIQTNDFDVRAAGESRKLLYALREAGEDGRLKARVSVQMTADDLEALDTAIRSGLNPGFGNRRFNIHSVKLYTDGSLGARTAYLSQPYHDDPSTRGLTFHSQQQLNALVGLAHRHNMPAVVHAIGDAAITMCLDAFEDAQQRFAHLSPRHGIVHCQITTKEQIARIARLGALVYAQPVFLDYDITMVRERVGKALAETSYAFKDYMDLGVHQSFGTDCPVEPFAPLRGVYCALTRKTLHKEGPYRADQCISAERALYAYTAEGAYATGEEHSKGKIRPGQLADFILLDRDLTEVSAEELLDARVLRTYVGGECVFAEGEA